MNLNVLQATKQTPSLKEDLYFQGLKICIYTEDTIAKENLKQRDRASCHLNASLFRAAFQNLFIVCKYEG